MARPKSKNNIKLITVRVSEDVVDFLNSLVDAGALYGNSHTEAATTLLLNKIAELTDSGTLQKRQESLDYAKSRLKKNKGKT